MDGGQSSPFIFLNQDYAEKIVSLHPIQKVWATVVPPKGLDSGHPVLILSEIEMGFTGKEGHLLQSDIVRNIIICGLKKRNKIMQKRLKN